MFKQIRLSAAIAAAIWATLFSSAGAAVPVRPAPVTAEQPPASSPTDVKAYGDWIVRCFPVKSPAPCDVFQATVQKDTQQRIDSVSIAYAPSAKAFVAKFVVPLGAKLQEGLIVISDKRASAPLVYSRCENNGCYAEGPLDSRLIDKLDGAKTASIVIALYSGGKLNLPLSLRGFPDAINAMRALAPEKASASSP